jgi:hypothetical protein
LEFGKCQNNKITIFLIKKVFVGDFLFVSDGENLIMEILFVDFETMAHEEGSFSSENPSNLRMVY